MKDFIQIIPGDGKSGPIPDNWTEWNSGNDATRESVRDTALNKFLRESGFQKRGATFKAQKFTVHQYREGDPLHPNGRPMVVHATTFEITPTIPEHPYVKKSRKAGEEGLTVWR
jgi:hypothetical protein